MWRWMEKLIECIYDLYRSRHMQMALPHSCPEQNLAPAPVSNANEKTHITTGLWLCGDSTPQIASVPVGVLFCFVFSSPMTLDLWNYCKGDLRKSSCPHPVQHLTLVQPIVNIGTRLFQDPGGCGDVFFTHVPSGPFTPVISQRPRAHLLNPIPWSSVDVMLSQASVNGSWSDMGRQSISRTFSTGLA